MKNQCICIIVGNAASQPEIRHTPTKKRVSRFRVAVNAGFKDQASGEWVNKANFFNVVAWTNTPDKKGLAEHVEETINKGTPVYVYGRLESRSFEDKQGVKKEIVEVVAEIVNALENPKNTPRQTEIIEEEYQSLQPVEEDVDVPF